MNVIPNPIISIIYQYDNTYREVYDKVMSELIKSSKLPHITNFKEMHVLADHKLYNLWKRKLNIATDGIYGNISDSNWENDSLFSHYSMILKRPLGNYKGVLGFSVLDYIYFIKKNGISI